MKKAILLFLIFGLVPLISCNKQDSGPGDPCAKISCLNGGYCANGQCVCPEGYTGADCSQQVTPDIIRINKIEVVQFPPTDNGAGWDLTSGPDIYPVLLQGSTVLWNSPTYFQNASSGSNYSFTPGPAIELSNPGSQYIINLYDYDDLSADDFMGGIIFTPYQSTAGFPKVIALDAGGGVAFRLYLSYRW